VLAVCAVGRAGCCVGWLGGGGVPCGGERIIMCSRLAARRVNPAAMNVRGCAWRGMLFTLTVMSSFSSFCVCVSDADTYDDSDADPAAYGGDEL